MLGSYNGPGGSPRPVAMVPKIHTLILWLLCGRSRELRYHGEREKSLLQHTRKKCTGSYSGPGGCPRPVAMVPNRYARDSLVVVVAEHGSATTEKD